MALVFAAGLLDPSFGLAIWILITFSILLILLGRFAWKPIMNALEEREGTIEESITRAEKALSEAKQMQADNEAARRDAERQAQSIMAEAREKAEAYRAEQETRTRDRIQTMQEQAQAEIERSKQQAIQELRAEVAEMAVQGAEKILATKLDDADEQRRLVQRFISEIPQN